MIHKAEIVQRKKIGNGKIAFRVRCCNDPETDSWASLHVRQGTDVAAAKAREIARVEAEHEAMILADEELAKP